MLDYIIHYVTSALLAGATFGYISDYLFIKKGRFFLIHGHERAFRAMGAALLLFSIISFIFLTMAEH
jgi:hypothetical protein